MVRPRPLTALLGATVSLLASAAPSPVLPQQQQVLFDSPPLYNQTGPLGHGHFSEWSRETKESFLKDLFDGSALSWTIVLGNEGGDMDSMAAALAWAYHLTHLDPPQKAIAILQTEEDALFLRPENTLALNQSRMSTGHRDLLTIDELPIKPADLWHRTRGIALVDHNIPRAMWSNATILSIIDHHEDGGLALDASPRLIAVSASCSSLVSKIILDAKDERRSMHGGMPKEMVDLLLRTISLDSGGLDKDDRQKVDLESARRLFPMSSWRDKDFKDTMKSLSKELTASKRGLEELSVRDLLRRDWKSDSLATKSDRYPALSLGFASIPVSLNEQILRTPEATVPEWFAIERAYTAEALVDVSVMLTNYRDSKDVKIHEIALTVAHGWGKRLNEKAADRLFHALKHAIEEAEQLKSLKKWKRPDGKPLLPRRAVWTHTSSDAGRKVLRPIIEKAVKEWRG